MTSKRQIGQLNCSHCKEDEIITSKNITEQDLTKLDDESLIDVCEEKINTEKDESVLKEDEESRCDNVGYLKCTLKTTSVVEYNSNSAQFHAKETTPEAESGIDIDNSVIGQFSEETVLALEESGETENLTYTRGDFESGCSSSDTEESSAMGAFVCTNSQKEDAISSHHKEDKRKMSQTPRDGKKLKQLTINFRPKEKPKESSKHRHLAVPYNKKGDRHSRRIEEKNEKTAPRKRFNDRDTQEYRDGYPGKEDNPCLNDNLRFYRGEIMSTPKGAYIDDIHENWWGDMDLLETHHGYIQWLFPIRESGMNSKAQPLQLHEAEKIRADPTTRKRVLKSYKMMLNFYGMRLQSERTGKLERSENWKICFNNLKRSPHNYLRITRILKCLGELGYEHLKKGFIQFVLEEALTHQTLVPTMTSCRDYWIGTIKDDQDRRELYSYIDEYESS